MWATVIEFLAELGLGMLGALFEALSGRAKAQGLDAAALDEGAQLVASAEDNPALDTGEKKYEWVFAQYMQYFQSHSLEVSTSLVDATIHLLVNSLHYSKEQAKPSGG